MPITAIARNFNGDPNIVTIVTTDDLATITTADYLSTQESIIDELNNGPFQWTATDIVLIAYSPSLVNWFIRDESTNTFVANPSIESDVTATQVQQLAFNYGTDTGTSNNYIVNLSPAITSLTDGLIVAFQAANANDSVPNITINGIGPSTISNYDSNVSTVTAGQISNTQITLLMYSATDNAFLLLNPALQPYAEVLSVQQSLFNQGADTGGSANNYIVNLSPAIGSLTDGLLVSFTPAHANTGASGITINGVGPTDIVNYDTGNQALISGQLATTQIAFLIYSATLTKFLLLNPAVSAGGGGGVTSTQVQQSAFNFGTDTGTTNHYVVNLTPAVASLTDGLLVSFTPSTASNTGNAFLNLNGLGERLIVDFYGSNLSAGQMTFNQPALLMYGIANDEFILLNPLNLPFATRSQVAQGFCNFGTDSGAADAYVVSSNVPQGSYHDGQVIAFTPANTSLTTTPTLNLDGNGAKTMTTSNAAVALTAGAIATTQLCYCVYSLAADKFLVLTPAA